MKKWLLILGLTLTGIAGSVAEVVSPEQAEKVAKQRFEEELTLVSVRQSACGDTLYYVFSFGDCQGYCLISAEDRTAPLLGYASQGYFDEDRLPVGLRGLLQSYENQITQVRKSAVASVHPDWAALEPAEERLLHTANWGQGYPYNVETPSIDGAHAPTGSVPTAAAVVMKYHEYPLSLMVGRTSHQGKGIYWGGFDWMRITPQQPIKPVEIDAVSRLLWVVGGQAQADYGTAATNVPLYRMWRVLQSDFEYGTTNHYLRSSDLSVQRWESLIREEIDASCPVLYEGGSLFNGQAVVCDGYSSDGLFHINWCDYGLGNGFYRLTLDGDGVAADWPADQAMVIGLEAAWPWLTVEDRHPDFVDSIVKEDLAETVGEEESNILEILKKDKHSVTLLLRKKERVLIMNMTGFLSYDGFLEAGKHRITLPRSLYTLYYGDKSVLFVN